MARKSKQFFFVFFFNDTATTEIYTLSLHDALPIWEEGLKEEEGVERRMGELPETTKKQTKATCLRKPTPQEKQKKMKNNKVSFFEWTV